MNRRIGLYGLMLILAAGWIGQPAPARGADADVLKAVPENAWGVLIIRNLGELDQKLMALFQQLNVPPMSGLMLAKGSLGLAEGINDNGSAAVIFMPGAAVMAEPQKSLAILVPTTDYAALTKNLAPEDAGEGISKVMIAMEESYIAQHGGFVVAGPAPESVKAILSAANGPGLGAAWTPHQLERFKQDDITLMLNLKSVLGDPAIAGMIVGMAAMSGQQVTQEQLQEWETVTITLRLEKDGARLGVYMGFKEGSETAQIWATGETTTKSMLTGLPGEQYVFAFGTLQDAASAQKMAEKIEKDFQKNMAMLPPEVDRAKMTETIGLMSGMFRDMRDLSVSVTALPTGADGLVGFAKVVTFEKGAVEKCGKIAEILQAVGAAVPMPEVQQALKAIKYSAGEEKVGGVNVDHLVIAVDQMEGVDQESFQKFKKVVGGDGLLFRVAAIDDKRVVATLGGGSTRLQHVIELVQGNAAPLSANEGIKKAAAMLSNNRYFEGYLAADNAVNLASEIAKAVGEEPVPFPVPAVDPLAMVMSPAGKSAVQTDIAIPMSFIVAAKNLATTMQGGGGGGPGPQVNAAD